MQSFRLVGLLTQIARSVRLFGANGSSAALNILELVYSVRLFGSLIRFAYSSICLGLCTTRRLFGSSIRFEW